MSTPRTFAWSTAATIVGFLVLLTVLWFTIGPGCGPTDTDDRTAETQEATDRAAAGVGRAASGVDSIARELEDATTPVPPPEAPRPTRTGTDAVDRVCRALAASGGRLPSYCR